MTRAGVAVHMRFTSASMSKGAQHRTARVCIATIRPPMQGGDRLLVMTPGGGGFGDPDEAADEEMEDAGALPAAC